MKRQPMYQKSTDRLSIKSFIALSIALCLLMVSGCNNNVDNSQDTNSLHTTHTNSADDSTTSSAEEGGSTTDTQETTTPHFEEEATTSKPSLKTTKKTTTTTRLPTRTNPISKLSERKQSEIGFGYFGAFISNLGLSPDVDRMVESDYVNVVFSDGNAYDLRMISENNVKAWVSVYNIYSLITRGAEGWEQVFDQRVQQLKDTGYWDAVLGWYLDEPINHEAILTITKYAKEKYNKRFLICYMAGSMAPDYKILGTMDTVGISERTTAYLTDISYNLYWDATVYRGVYEYVNRSMHQLLGKNNPKVWYVPNLAFWGSVLESSEESQKRTLNAQMAHLELMYEFLQQENNPGGLLCYAYNIANTEHENQYGWKQANQLTDGLFVPLFQRSVEIGREICTGKSVFANK